MTEPKIKTVQTFECDGCRRNYETWNDANSCCSFTAAPHVQKEIRSRSLTVFTVSNRSIELIREGIEKSANLN